MADEPVRRAETVRKREGMVDIPWSMLATLNVPRRRKEDENNG